jgi:hypothetical protein
MHLSGHLGGAGFIIVEAPMRLYSRDEYVVRYHRGALKFGSYARANLLLAFADKIHRAQQTMHPCITSNRRGTKSNQQVYRYTPKARNKRHKSTCCA